MPRKPKPPEKHTTVVTVNGQPVRVTLHPPTGRKTSWYAYWNGLKNGGKSTGQRDREQALNAVAQMVSD
jgi:hypothetical protein